MLQKYVNRGDTIYFGIDPGEMHRAARITPIYERFGCKTIFPLIDQMVYRHEMFSFIRGIGVEIPKMYRDGFTHNNCSGGCVRAGKKQWKSLYRVYPEVYAERERVEREFSEWIGKPCTFLKDQSLADLRNVMDQQPDLDFDDGGWEGE